MQHSTPICRHAGGHLSSPNRFRFGFFVLLILFSGVCLVSNATSVRRTDHGESDSMRTYRLDSIVVSAPRIESSPAFTVTNTLAVSGVRDGRSLAQLLPSVPATMVRNYGGIGALATVSFRGMDPSETVVLLDGVRINGLQHGMVDLSKLPLTGLASTTVSSADLAFDQGAAGVLNIQSSLPRNHPSSAIALTAGSFGETDFFASVNAGSGPIAGMVSANYTHAQNDFPFSVNGETRPRANADFTMRSMLARVSLNAFGTGDLSPTTSDAARDGPQYDLLITAVDAEEGIPSSVGSNAGGARQHDGQVIGMLRSLWIDSPTTHLESSIAGIYADETYTDSGLLLNGTPLRSSSITRSLALSGDGSIAVDPYWRLHGGVRETAAAASSNDLVDASRFETQAMFGPEITLAPTSLFQLARVHILGRCDIAADRLANASSTVHSLVTISAGALGTFRDLPTVTLRAFAGTTGRIPTFNDLYWHPGGNPDLQTEHSLKFEIGAHIGAQLFGAWTFDVAAYLIDARDKIVWEPANGAIWSPVNIRHVVVRGVTIAAAWSPLSWVTVQATDDIATHERAAAEFVGDPTVGMQLPYVPQQTAAGTLMLHGFEGALAADATVRYASYRYTTASNAVYLPSYTTIDLGIEGRVALAGVIMRPAVRCTNVTNLQYEILEGYPLPLRAFRFTLTTQFNEQ